MFLVSCLYICFITQLSAFVTDSEYKVISLCSDFCIILFQMLPLQTGRDITFLARLICIGVMLQLRNGLGFFFMRLPEREQTENLDSFS